METFEYQFEKTEDYSVSLELCADHVFVHCTVMNNKLSVYKKVKSLLNDLKVWCESLGYNDLYSYAEDPSFMMSISKSIEYLGPIVNKGITYEVFRWPKAQQ